MADINWTDVFNTLGRPTVDDTIIKKTKPKPNWNVIFNNVDGKNVDYDFDKGLLYIVGRKMPDIQADNDMVEYYIMNSAYTYNNLFLSKIPDDMKWKLLTTISPCNGSYRRNWPKSKQLKKDKTIATLQELFPDMAIADLEVVYNYTSANDIKQYKKDRGDTC